MNSGYYDNSSLVGQQLANQYYGARPPALDVEKARFALSVLLSAPDGLVDIRRFAADVVLEYLKG